MESAAVMKRASCSVALLLLTLCASVAQAASTDSLATNPDSYNDPTWRGSVTFYDAQAGRVLSGHIDYAVFRAADFSYPGYAPTDPVVYAYQIFVDGATVGSDISHLSVSLTGFLGQQDIASGISSIPSTVTGFLGGSVPSNYSLDPINDPLPGDHLFDSANWFFTPVIPANGYSEILVFSSPFLPTWGAWGVDDSGLSDGFNNTNHLGNLNTQVVPTPGSEMIPEPGTATLLCLAGLFGMPVLIRRFRRR